ncbi:hypothetical protein HMPREF3038_02241 [Akkermansia sp. KLE1797]|nr:hypothetical protein HMPREF3038_02241 [Akkermansia sp. KLE1797]KXU53202.1 hypothetical protein HMPREF3039_02612 [Akkermansia sp. KLE1798]
MQGRRRHSIAYFPAKKSFHSIGIRKIPGRKCGAGIGDCFVSISAKMG